MSDQRRSAGIVDLVTASDAASGAPWWQSMLIVVGCCAALVVLVILVRRFNGRDPLDTGFVRLARKLGLSRRQRASLKALGERAGVPPVALMLSPSALHAAAEGEGDDPAAVALIQSLGR